MPYEMLDGSKRPIRLDRDLQLIAPSLRGRVTVHRPSPDRVRSSPGLGSTLLEEGLKEAGMLEQATVELDVREVPGSSGGGDVRGPGDEPAMELHVTRPGSDMGAVVLVQDQFGGLSWHFPLDEANEPVDPVRSGERLVFRIPRQVVPGPRDEEPTRSLLGTVGKKLLKVILFPVAARVAGAAVDKLAEAFETKHRAYRIRPFTPDDYQSDEAPPLQPTDWEHLQGGRALLFVHGTFSRAASAFGGLPREVMEELSHVYGNRLFAFDHFTLSHSPRQNVDRFLAMLPAGTRLEVDIICHSRGGLVARTLAEEYEQVKRPGVEVTVGRVIFVGVPNQGTLLADPKHMVSLLDRYTTLLNVVPVPGVSQVLGGIATAVQIIGQGALTSLEGLMAMRPRAVEVNACADPGGRDYYAITAEYDPDAAGIGYLVKGKNLAKHLLATGGAVAVDKLADDVFVQAPNDLVVPTDGVYEANGSANFPLTGRRVFRFDHSAGVTHVTYFSQHDTAGCILGWLAPPKMAESAPPEGWAESAPPDEEMAESSPGEPFRAYPDLQAPDRVEPGKQFYLTVSLSLTEVAKVTTVVPLEVPLAPETQEFTLDVRVMAAGFDAPRGWEQTLTVDRQNPDMGAIRIPLIARQPSSGAPAKGRIWVHFFHKGTDCGAAYREVWVGQPAAAEPPAAEAQPAAPAIRLEAGTAPADITLAIADTSLRDDIFAYAIKTIHGDVPVPKENGEFELSGMNAARFTAELMKEVQSRRREPEIADVLQAKGAFIARLIKQDHWDAIKAICRHVQSTRGREPTLFIHSAELHIPWELASFSLDPQRPAHLGAQVAMGRWYRPLNGDLPVPDPVMDVQAVAVVWSDYTGTAKPQLKQAKVEAEFLEEQFHAKLLAARKEQVISLLDGQPQAQVFHFACHGETDPTYAGTALLDLEDGPFTPDLVFVRKQEQNRPFVFLNVCQVGQTVEVLHSNAGFTGAFLEARSRGCVGPLWEVRDTEAMAFVREFYERTLQQGEPVGTVLRDLRARFRRPAPGEATVDPTCMAYVYYGHPNLVLKQG